MDFFVQEHRDYKKTWRECQVGSDLDEFRLSARVANGLWKKRHIRQSNRNPKSSLKTISLLRTIGEKVATNAPDKSIRNGMADDLVLVRKT